MIERLHNNVPLDLKQSTYKAKGQDWKRRSDDVFRKPKLRQDVEDTGVNTKDSFLFTCVAAVIAEHLTHSSHRHEPKT